MNVAILSPLDLSIAAALILILAGLSFNLKLGLESQILIASIRMTIQLLLIGLVLHYLFSSGSVWLIILVSQVMLLAAGREVRARLKRKLRGFFGYHVGITILEKVDTVLTARTVTYEGKVLCRSMMV